MSERRKWTPGHYIFMGLLFVVVFGLPGVTSFDESSPMWLRALALLGALGFAWLLIGLISLVINASSKR